MRRREFITLTGGAMVTWPIAAHTQQPAIPTVGFLHSASPAANVRNVAAFEQGLAEIGFVVGKNVLIEYRWAEGQFDQLSTLVGDLIHRQVTVIATFAPPAIVAAKSATTTIPIIFTMGGDPVRLGIVASLNRPGGNISGISMLTIHLVAKRLGLLHEMVPTAKSFGFLVNPANPTADTQIESVGEAARAVGLEVWKEGARDEQQLETAFAIFAKRQVGAVVIGADSFFISRRKKIASLAATYALPTIYEVREAVLEGGLISYSPSFPDSFRQAGVYVGRVLKGEKPSELPILQPTKFELAINVRTAKTLGLTIPLTLLALADEVIE